MYTVLAEIKLNTCIGAAHKPTARCAACALLLYAYYRGDTLAG
jgi:hypothetical protein